MRVCTAKEMAAIDRDTIAGGVSGETLMERAGTAMTEILWEYLEGLDHNHPHQGAGLSSPQVLVICGKGNNGGDGLVIARLLHEDSAEVTVMMLAGRGELSPESRLNFNRLPSGVSIVHAAAEQWAATLEQLNDRADVVVDAIFGTGIKPPIKGAYVEMIRTLNDSGIPTVAVDIPSGVCGDDGRVDPVAVEADLTITVGLPKRGSLLRPGRNFTGDQVVVDIGFAEETCLAHTSDHHCLLGEDYLALLPPRPTDTHKYRCGTALVVAGSRSYGGAAHLAGLGALRSGAGLVTVAVPLCLEIPTRVGLPEALVVPLTETENGTIAPVPNAALAAMLVKEDALAIGPGLASHPDTDRWVVDTLGHLEIPMVVDADALGAFARLGQDPHFGSQKVVLTPHAGELARLVGLTSAQVEKQKLELVPELAKKWKVTLLLKGSTSLIADPEGQLFFNPSGDDALARGGSGDVLTGLIAGLLAQGCGATEAALLGAYVHGSAGTLAAEGRSTRSVLVRETAAAIGLVFDRMEKEASATAELRERIRPVGRGDT